MKALCSTAGCKRERRPGWAVCDHCALDLLAPVPVRVPVVRLSRIKEAA